MPFKSRKQMRWMFANHPAMAKRWADHTPDPKSLPESSHEPKSAADPTAGWDPSLQLNVHAIPAPAPDSSTTLPAANFRFPGAVPGQPQSRQIPDVAPNDPRMQDMTVPAAQPQSQLQPPYKGASAPYVDLIRMMHGKEGEAPATLGGGGGMGYPTASHMNPTMPAMLGASGVRPAATAGAAAGVRPLATAGARPLSPAGATAARGPTQSTPPTATAAPSIPGSPAPGADLLAPRQSLASTVPAPNSGGPSPQEARGHTPRFNNPMVGSPNPLGAGSLAYAGVRAPGVGKAAASDKPAPCSTLRVGGRDVRVTYGARTQQNGRFSSRRSTVKKSEIDLDGLDRDTANFARQNSGAARLAGLAGLAGLATVPAAIGAYGAYHAPSGHRAEGAYRSISRVGHQAGLAIPGAMLGASIGAGLAPQHQAVGAAAGGLAGLLGGGMLGGKLWDWTMPQPTWERGKPEEKEAAEVVKGGPVSRAVANTVGHVGNALGAGFLMTTDMHRNPLKHREEHEKTVEDFERVRPQELSDTVVRLGGTDLPSDLWRTWTNPRTGPVGKVVGTLATPLAGLTATLLRSPHYNPWSDTVVQFADNQPITQHELGHAIDFNSEKPTGGMLHRAWQGTKRDAYSLAYALPAVKLWHEGQANLKSHKALKEIHKDDPDEMHRQSVERMKVLPAGYGSYVGNLATPLVGPAGPLVGMIGGRAGGRAAAAQMEADYAEKKKQRHSPGDADGDGVSHEHTPQERRKAAATSIHRELTPEEEADVAAGQSRMFPTLWRGAGTPLPELMSSPAKGAVGYGLLGAGIGGLAGAGLGALSGHPAGAAAGGAIGAGIGGLGLGAYGHASRARNNEDLADLMRRLPHGATYRDYQADSGADYPMDQVQNTRAMRYIARDLTDGDRREKAAALFEAAGWGKEAAAKVRGSGRLGSSVRPSESAPPSCGSPTPRGGRSFNPHGPDPGLRGDRPFDAPARAADPGKAMAKGRMQVR